MFSPILPTAFLRNFSTSSRIKTSFFARTTIFPKKDSGVHVPANLNARLVIFLSTPQNLPLVIENAIHLHQHMGLQIVVAGVDRTVPNGAGSGISELWMDSLMKIGPSTLLAAKDSRPPLRESDGISPVGAKVNWKHVEGNLSLRIQDNVIDLALANTAFATNTLTTLFYFQKNDPQSPLSGHMGQTLSELQVTLPDLAPRLNLPVSRDRWTSLTADQELIITNCTGNLVKSINGQPASQYLEKNKKLMDLASKETKVYVKVYSEGSTAPPKKYEVIAGGGGWGAKADLLAISPEAKLRKGDRVEFHMVTPLDRYATGSVAPALVSQQFLFECAPEATSYEEKAGSSQSIENLFGAGSEQGFIVNGINYKSPGESLSFPYGHQQSEETMKRFDLGTPETFAAN